MALINFGRRWRRLADLSLLAVAFCLCHSPFIFRNFTPIPITTVGVVPGGTAGQSANTNYLGVDFGGTIAELSMAQFAKNAIASGELPFWNPYHAVGAPQVGEPAMLAPFYPLNWLRLLLPAAWWDMVTSLGVFLAGCFVWGLAREWGQGRAAAIFSGAAVYTLGTTQLYLAVPSVANTVTWVPALWWIAARVLRQRRVGWMWLAATGATYCIITAGSVTPALMGAVTMALYVAIRCVVEPSLIRVALKMVPGFLCGMAIAAPHILTFLDYTGMSGARLALRGNAFTYGPLMWPSVVIPYLFGSIHSATRFAVAGLPVGYYTSLGWLTPLLSLVCVAGIVCTFARRQADQFAFLAAPALLLLLAIDPYPLSLLTRVYPWNRINNQYTPWIAAIGLCPFAGLGLTWLLQVSWRRRRHMLWAFAAALGLCAAASLLPLLPLLPLLLRPLAEMVALPTLLIIGGGVGIAAGWVGVILLVFGDRRDDDADPRMPLAFSAFLVAAISYFPYGWSAEVSLGLRAGCVMAFAAVLLMMRHATIRWRAFPAAAACLLVAGAVVAVNVLAPLGLPVRRNPFNAPPFVDYLRDKTAEHRVFGLDGLLFPNTAGAFGISSLNSMSPMMPDWEQDVVGRLAGSVRPAFLWGIGLGGDPWDLIARNPRQYDYLAVRYVVVPRSKVPATATIAFSDPAADAVVLERPGAQSRAYVAGTYEQAPGWKEAGDRFLAQPALRGTAFGETGQPVCASSGGAGVARIARLTPNTIVIETEAEVPGTLVLVDAWMPGWTATLDGRSVTVQRINGAFRGLCLDSAGPHHVEMRYVPPLWRTGVAISLIAILALLLSIAAQFWRGSPLRVAGIGRPAMPRA